MIIEYFDIRIIFEKEIKNDNEVSFKCPYNNETNFNDLLEIISILFPELKICPCSKYEIKNKIYFKSINKNDNIKEYIYSIKSNEITLKIYKENDKCICESNYQKYNQKTKKDVIDDLINSYKEIIEIKILKNENENYEKEFEKFKTIFIKNEKNNNPLKKEIKDYIDKINKILEEKKELKEESKKKDFDYINEIREKKITNKNENDTEPEEFYDVIIDIKSIKDIKDGWDIKMNDDGEKKYTNFKKKEVIKIGVIGNSNKGKSFLLSKISKIKLPSGTSIRTEGLSIKYPVLEDNINRKIVLLDSAGFEKAIIKREKENKKVNEKECLKEKSKEKLIT